MPTTSGRCDPQGHHPDHQKNDAKKVITRRLQGSIKWLMWRRVQLHQNAPYPGRCVHSPESHHLEQPSKYQCNMARQWVDLAQGKQATKITNVTGPASSRQWREASMLQMGCFHRGFYIICPTLPSCSSKCVEDDAEEHRSSSEGFTVARVFRNHLPGHPKTNDWGAPPFFHRTPAMQRSWLSPVAAGSLPTWICPHHKLGGPSSVGSDPTYLLIHPRDQETLLVHDTHQASLRKRRQSTRWAAASPAAIPNRGPFLALDPATAHSKHLAPRVRFPREKRARPRRTPLKGLLLLLWPRSRTPLREPLGHGCDPLCHLGWITARLHPRDSLAWAEWCSLEYVIPFVAAQSKHPQWLLDLGSEKNFHAVYPWCEDKLQDLCTSEFTHTICFGSFCTHTHTHTHLWIYLFKRCVTRTTAIILHPQVSGVVILKAVFIFNTK